MRQPRAAAPDCPRWCGTHTDPHCGWEAAEKVCRRCIPVGTDLDGDPVLVLIDRHAFAEDGHVETEGPTCTVRCSGPLSDGIARRLAQALTTAAEAIALG